MNPLFTQLKTVRGLDDGPLCPYVQPYITQLQKQGYQPKTVRQHLFLFARFNCWLKRTDRGLCDLNEEIVNRFLRRRCARLQKRTFVLRDQYAIIEAEPKRGRLRMLEDRQTPLSEDYGCCFFQAKFSWRRMIKAKSPEPHNQASNLLKMFQWEFTIKLRQ